ncbi:RNA polymerase sigma factor [Actinocrispum wychmicini]|uniref:RNA polymerase sigma factor (Sigma-70 family) n=1 Tax=Actinocrispum wychmicini TaxID=1213861 RepID=A0A4R2JWF4_9PSEU|nr:sigma-70 family RNA polymerase sigma factor [Actinocrispum wychmicini]TCO58495.1 RNA polymerase sigma factor (sigma-70 family) [Actinocrispum wychmicini]
MTTDSETLALLCVTHRALVFRICRRILGNDEDAEDATQEVFERAARYLQDKEVEKPSAYLTQVAHNTATDVLTRKLKRLETAPLPDDLVPAQATAGDAEERLALLAAEQLAEQMRPFLTAKQDKRLRIRIAAGLGRISDADAAAALGIKQSSLQATDGHMSVVFTEAAVAARMTAAPTCDFVARLVSDGPPSRVMWKQIEAHTEKCEACAERKAREKRKVRETFAAMPGFLAVPTKAGAFALRKGLIAAGVGAAACLTVAAINTSPFSTPLPRTDYVAPKTSVSAVAAPPVTLPSSTTHAVASDDPPAARPSAAPSPRQPSNVPAAPPVPSAPAPRADTPLAITAGPDAIEHATISTTACAGPTTSAIRVGITSSHDLALVRLAMQLNGKTQTVPMRNTGGSTWVGTVGPYQAGTPGGPIRIAVVAIDRGGSAAERYVGTVVLRPCG